MVAGFQLRKCNAAALCNLVKHSENSNIALPSNGNFEKEKHLFHDLLSPVRNLNQNVIVFPPRPSLKMLQV
jgi:hypothetical protein